MGPQAAFTIHPECIEPGVPLPKKPPLRPALKFNSNDLAHALFFTGKVNDKSHLSAHPPRRWPRVQANKKLQAYLRWELISRYAMVRAYIEPRRSTQHSGENDLALSPLVENLDGSEKACLSYFLGQAITGIYCYETLDVVQLLHASRAQDYFKGCPDVIFPTGSRPDLIGIDIRCNGVVAEAKCRTEASKKQLEDLAIAADLQLRSVHLLHHWYSRHHSRRGPYVWCPLGQRLCHYCPIYCASHRIGCIASFKSIRDPMRLHVLDDRCPSRRGAAGYRDDVRLDEQLRSEHLYRCYLYACAAVGGDQTRSRESGSDAGPFRTVELPDTGITFGVLDSIYALFERTGRDDPDAPDDGDDPDVLQGFAGEIDRILRSLNLGDPGSRNQESRDQGMFPDGTFFQADWSFEPGDAEAT